MEKKEKCYSDMYFVAALLSYSPHSFCRVDKTDRKRQQFHFNDTVLEVFIMAPDGPKAMKEPTLDELQNWYTAGILMFKPNYPECIKKIKSEVHL
jgi:hypothetical protein